MIVNINFPTKMICHTKLLPTYCLLITLLPLNLFFPSLTLPRFNSLSLSPFSHFSVSLISYWLHSLSLLNHPHNFHTSYLSPPFFCSLRRHNTPIPTPLVFFFFLNCFICIKIYLKF